MKFFFFFFFLASSLIMHSEEIWVLSATGRSSKYDMQGDFNQPGNHWPAACGPADIHFHKR